MEQGTNRVYLNRDFQRAQKTTYNQMHINPIFTQKLSTGSTNSISCTKIYVNPNYMRTNNITTPYFNNQIKTTSALHKRNSRNSIIAQNMQNVESTLSEHVTLKSKSRYELKSALQSRNAQNSIGLAQNTQDAFKKVLPEPVSLTSTSKSRYKLVRNNQNKQSNSNEPENFNTVEVATTSYKINRYKSVSIQRLKNINNIKKEEKPKTKVDETSAYASRYKIVKTKLKQIPVQRNIKVKRLSTSMTIKIKQKINRQFKMNNIPCPLFRKFGKCLRNIRGKCDFLHDKKHVSVCRKFLKGICHDKQCLLSHDLSKEKMPTCYFYLKGMCTRDNCPYIHVKLSEKSKICVEFLKGYCANGDECSNRHINLCPDMATKGVCFKRQCPNLHKVKSSKSKVRTMPSARSFVTSSPQKRSSKAGENQVKAPLTKVEEGRYYKGVEDKASEENYCVNIMPSRCKLGSLPSFIQL